MEENEITVKIRLAKTVSVNQALLLDIINGLNARYVPCNEIYLNDNLIFNDKEGFIKRKEIGNDAEFNGK